MMIRLNDWFRNNARRPLSIAVGMVLVLWTSIVIAAYYEMEKSQRDGFTQFVDVMALALAQKNRALIESILQTAQTQTNALSVAVCEDDQPLISSRFEGNACGGSSEWFTRAFKNEIPGFANHHLVMSFSKLAIDIERAMLLFLGLGLMGVTVVILRNVQIKFAQEVLMPLRDGVLGSEPLQILELEDLRKAHHEAQAVKTKIAVAEAVMVVAKQVAHDIRSPLSALNMVVGSAKELPEDKRLIMRGAVQRINDIANGLLKQGKDKKNESPTSSPSAEPVMLVALLDAIISEKRTQYRDKVNVEIEGQLSKGYGLFAKVSPTELSRVISNLVNNSVEAFERGGRVSIGIRSEGGQAMITVEDNGKGIPAELLSRLGERGVTHGKDGTQSGSGLGVAHARETMESAGGSLEISSTVAQGTLLTLKLPKAEVPSWFLDRLRLQPDTMLISVDDDQSIHQIWSGRLTSSLPKEASIEHVRFTSLEEFELWLRANKRPDHRYLVDYEFLGQSGNGLAVIERLQLQDQAILVTSRYEEPQIQEKARALRLKILPKGLAPLVPIEVDKPRAKYDAVVIDDDTLMHMTWQMAASEQSKTCLCFASPEVFFARASEVHLDSPVMIDVNLGGGVRGEDVARQVISMGFRTVYLTTGYDADSIVKPQGVKAVIGKEPQFAT